MSKHVVELQALGQTTKYLKWYISICETVYLDEYTEKHHILPKSIFPQFSSFKEHPWNMARLSAKAHF